MRLTEPGRSLPPFIWDASALHSAEWLYLAEAGRTAGAATHLSARRQTEFLIAALTRDAVASLELEGSLVPAEEMENCVRSRLGLAYAASNSARCEEEGPRCCMADLAAATLRRGNFLAAPTAADAVGILDDLGARLGGGDNSPPARRKTQARRNTRRELASFAAWFTATDEIDAAEAAASPLTQAGLAHLWFEAIHPYRFGSGIVGRALAENALLWRHPAVPFAPLSPILLSRQNEYYARLDQSCGGRDATEWLLWFAEAVIEAVRGHRAGFSDA